MIGGLQRRPLQPYQQEQEREEERRCGDDGERGESAPGSGCGRHGPLLPVVNCFTPVHCPADRLGATAVADLGGRQMPHPGHVCRPAARGSDGYALCIGAGRNAHRKAGFRQPGGTLPGPRGPDRARCHLHPGRLGRGAGRAGAQLARGGPAGRPAAARGQILRAGLALAARHRLRGLRAVAAERGRVRRHRRAARGRPPAQVAGPGGHLRGPVLPDVHGDLRHGPQPVPAAAGHHGHGHAAHGRPRAGRPRRTDHRRSAASSWSSRAPAGSS